MSHDDKIKRIFGERAEFYTTSSAHTDPFILEKLVRLSNPNPEWRVLDIATGTGHTAFAFSPFVKSIIGIDLTPEMLEEAEKIKKQMNFTNLEFRQGNVHSLTFPAEYFDLITCRRAFHHFQNQNLALQEMRRVLKPNGILLIDDRSVPEDNEIDQIMNSLDKLHDESHIREYSTKEWNIMLNNNGFKVLSSESYNKFRPLSAFTSQVNPENVQKIHEIINNLSPNQKKIFNLKKIKGEFNLNHWFIMIKAKKMYK
jgi:ubiquinone/menaquinone biosynthesis C-methylase UbiE